MAIVINGSGTVTGITAQASDVELTDSTKIMLGTGDDLQIYHDTTNGSIIKDNGDGRLILDSTNGSGISLTSGNIAKDMISFAETQCHGFIKICVGTQLANMPSVNLYENIGFRFSGAHYVFHYHNK